jgi:hypothetical protein
VRADSVESADCSRALRGSRNRVEAARPGGPVAELPRAPTRAVSSGLAVALGRPRATCPGLVADAERSLGADNSAEIVRSIRTNVERPITPFPPTSCVLLYYCTTPAPPRRRICSAGVNATPTRALPATFALGQLS